MRDGASMGKWENIRSIGLENVCNTSHEQTSNETEIPNIFPALLHVLLARLDTEKPTGRGIVVVAMVGGTEVAPSRERLDILRLPENTKGP